MAKKRKNFAPQKEDGIVMTGTIIKASPNACFRAVLENGHEVNCYISGKLRMNYIRIQEKDIVKIEISPYDPDRGRIIWRGRAGGSLDAVASPVNVDGMDGVSKQSVEHKVSDEMKN